MTWPDLFSGAVWPLNTFEPSLRMVEGTRGAQQRNAWYAWAKTVFQG